MAAIPPYIQKTEPSPKLTVDTLAKLESIFVEKSWVIDKVRKTSLFDRFCSTLLNLSQDEQAFLLDLTKRFIKIEAGEYTEYLETLAHQVRKDYPNSNLIFAPCLPKCDIGKVKSAGVALYDMESTSYLYQLGKHCIEKNDIAHIAPYIKDDAIILLVDDFVGTGETALGAVDYVHEVVGKDFPNDRIKVISIVTQQAGKNALNEIGIDVYTSRVENKGISDFYIGKALKNAIALMNSIESKIKKLKDEYKFGYMKSEALVCMRKCPNNTFPIYWLGKDTAPYERK